LPQCSAGGGAPFTAGFRCFVAIVLRRGAALDDDGRSTRSPCMKTAHRLGACALLAWTLAASAQPSAAPEVFAPGTVSGPSNDADASFSPDGTLLVFSRDGAVMLANRTPAGWSTPRIAPFSGHWMDAQPTLAPDGSALVFVSNRPLAEGDAKHPAGNLWRVERHGDGWGVPQHLPAVVNRGPSIWGPSVAADGSLYFMDRAGGSGPFKLWRAQAKGGTWLAPVLQVLGDPAMQQVDPTVAPDESFIVFSAKHPDTDEHERLYLALRAGAGWGPAIDLGAPVNLAGNDSNESRLAPDGRTLYFASDRQGAVHYPRTTAQAEADLARIAAWDNGNQNIWRVSLAPWLDASRNPG
jgi:Tol biopolymer transport system component